MKISVLVSVLVCATATVSSHNERENHQRQQVFSMNTPEPKPAGLPATNPTRSLWADSSPDANPLALEGSTGPLTSDADVCIIGSGITGVGVAYHLSEATQINALQSPLKVVILEARDFCAGATSRNLGSLTPAAFSGFFARATKYGSEEAKRSYTLETYTTSLLVRLIQEHGWENDVDLIRGGHIRLLSSDQQVEAVQRDRQAAADAGWSLDGVVYLSKEEVGATTGMHYPAVKYPGYHLSPLKLVTKLYQLTKSRAGLNLTLHTRTPVTGISRISSASESSTNTTRAYELATPRGTVACSRIVHGTNGHASHLLPFLAGAQGIFPVREQAIATHASLKANNWSIQLGSMGWYVPPVKTADEKTWIIISGAREAASSVVETYTDDDSKCHPKVGETLRGFLRTVLTDKLEPVQEPEMEWTGIIGYTAIRDPFVGPVNQLPAAQGTDVGKYAGQFIAAGYSGHGMPRAFGCAEVVAQMIVSELTGTEWTQPEWLPTWLLTWGERGNMTHG